MVNSLSSDLLIGTEKEREELKEHFNNLLEVKNLREVKNNLDTVMYQFEELRRRNKQKIIKEGIVPINDICGDIKEMNQAIKELRKETGADDKEVTMLLNKGQKLEKKVHSIIHH